MDVSAHWQDICHAIQEGVFLVDPSGRIVMVNEAMTRLSGYSHEELVGRSCKLFDCDACETSRRQAKGSWCRLFDGHPPRPKRCLIVRKDGLRIPVFKNQSVIRDSSDRVIGAVETVMDLSDLDRLDRKVEELSRLLDEPGSFHGMVGSSPAMRRLFDILPKAARSEAPVLLLGESGTGKELAARAIHELGPRARGPFVQLNCAALNESLLESELFGHARGAFTGAHRARRGRFEEAHGGDIFLDELGDAPLSIQVKLLRTLETKTIERVGENRPVPVDVRLIAATHQDLRGLIAQGRFREDFFFRVNVLPIVMPTLRERLDDLPGLAAHFLARHAARSGAGPLSLTPEALRVLASHAWPGNVRELKHALEYAAVLCEDGRIGPEDLPPGLGGPRASGCPDATLAAGTLARETVPPTRETAHRPAQGVPAPGSAPAPGACLACGLAPGRGAHREQALGPLLAPPPTAASLHGDRERDELVEALRQADGNKTRAAKLLGVTRLTVHNRMRKHGVECARVVRS
ncbi:Transcriptional regulatory protein ZraR [Fundidesulfovibrio magnetotacticus]|uniref:Transcriptional regulatory protein ZraR n=1 Tax=Fundidesulfovibrio magnetotacticus TaxID=2730080 RepID=A0A6V8LL47_9BACT|nr:sigma 54-interacting transcriptional regulator [Fundidesulfovibrio magnetotacticus]GFK92414.1 Transcriptional regulatory protein ZraR [Fundidesulfovibrio magnetotacticus]